MLLVTGTAHGEGGPLRGFVAAQLLKAWCTRDTPADVEACNSYLRGVFDSLNALLHTGNNDSDDRVTAVRCIPERVAVGELRAKYLRFVMKNSDIANRQAADLLMEVFQDAYDC